MYPKLEAIQVQKDLQVSASKSLEVNFQLLFFFVIVKLIFIGPPYLLCYFHGKISK